MKQVPGKHRSQGTSTKTLKRKPITIAIAGICGLSAFGAVSAPAFAATAPPTQTATTTQVVTLKYGNSGPLVVTLQQRLNSKLTPSPKLLTDGKFGNVTLTAVKAFQKKNKLVADGVVGPVTWKALGGFPTPTPTKPPVTPPPVVKPPTPPVSPPPVTKPPVTSNAANIANAVTLASGISYAMVNTSTNPAYPSWNTNPLAYTNGGTGYDQATPGYRAARSLVNAFTKDPQPNLFASCDRFVSTVTILTLDKNFPFALSSNMKQYMDSHPTLWKSYTSKSQAVPGDIWVTNPNQTGHIIFYVGNVNGVDSTASASAYQRVAALQPSKWFSDNLQEIYSLKRQYTGYHYIGPANNGLLTTLPSSIPLSNTVNPTPTPSPTPTPTPAPTSTN